MPPILHFKVDLNWAAVKSVNVIYWRFWDVLEKGGKKIHIFQSLRKEKKNWHKNNDGFIRSAPTLIESAVFKET